MPAVARVLDTSGVRLAELGRVVCGAGPGGFTSLRISAAIAKGLVSAGALRGRGALASVPSLLLIAAAAADRIAPGRYLVSIDALRGERYAMPVEVPPHSSLAERADRVRALGPWRRLDEAGLAAWMRETEAQLLGPDAAPPAWPEAWSAVRLQSAIAEVDPVSWEPDYGRLAEAQVRRELALGGAAAS